MEERNNSEVDAVCEERFEQQLHRLVLSIVGDRVCEVFLFGSRAQKRTRRSSDFDVGIRGLPAKEFDMVKARIVDAVEESHIPHEVDVVDFDRMLEPFRSVAQEERVVWKSV
ncbi:MAG: nucleotidyltransferase domain-containing protein [Spirochaetes bacterium]|nr:nucleotidyltransferase domain-containing protein [Spirochaetota bacterium]